MKFWQRFNKNTFRGIAVALVVAAAVMGGTDAALAAGEPVTEEQTKIISASLLQAGGTVFPIGNDNAAYARYFTGQSFLFPMANDTVSVSNVTFAPSCINKLAYSQRFVSGPGRGIRPWILSDLGTESGRNESR